MCYVDIENVQLEKLNKISRNSETVCVMHV